MNTASEYYKHQRKELAVLLPAQYQRVLEIGCGAGHFRRNLVQPCEYTGVEPSCDAAATARLSLNRVVTGTFDTAAQELPLHYFDLVTGDEGCCGAG